MESKVLNYLDGMKLADLLVKYIDFPIDKEKSILDFVDDLVGKIEPIDYLSILKLLNIDVNKRGKDLLDSVVGSFTSNRIYELLETYRLITKQENNVSS